MELTDISFERLVLDYQMDLAFRHYPAENIAMQSTCLYSEPFALVVPVNQPLNEQNFMGHQDLENEKFILSNLAQTILYTASLRQMLEEYNFYPNVYIETYFGDMGLVSKELGVSILPYSYAFSALPNVRFIRQPYNVNLYVHDT